MKQSNVKGYLPLQSDFKAFMGSEDFLVEKILSE